MCSQVVVYQQQNFYQTTISFQELISNFRLLHFWYQLLNPSQIFLILLGEFIKYQGLPFKDLKQYRQELVHSFFDYHQPVLNIFYVSIEYSCIPQCNLQYVIILCDVNQLRFFVQIIQIKVKMFDKIKKQKQQKANRNSLRFFPHLVQQPSSILLKTYPNIHRLNMLRMMTNVHLNYILFTYLETLQKGNSINTTLSQLSNITNVQNIKIGIIGGGVMGRLFLNSLLVLQKQGIELSNITVSTRQSEDMDLYKNWFKVNVEFDNEKLVEEADIIIITVPATLDNWIIADLKEVLQKRVGQNKSSWAKNNQKNAKDERKKLNPLVYITTSNMTKQKLSKLFSFPILTPFVRGEQEQYLDMALKQCKNQKNMDVDKYIEQLERYMKQRIAENVNDIKSSFFFAFERYFYNPQKQRKYTSIGSSDINSKSGKTISAIEGKIFPQNNRAQGQSFPLNRNLDKSSNDRMSEKNQKIESNQSSLNLTIFNSTTANAHAYNIEAIRIMIDETLSSHENVQQTFLIRSRKWRMAYNNFIA